MFYQHKGFVLGQTYLFCWAGWYVLLLGLLAAECPITFGTTQGGPQAMILLHMPLYSVLFIITMWVAINGTCIKSALVQVPPLMLGPVVFITRVLVITF